MRRRLVADAGTATAVNGFVDAVLGGWQLGGIVNARTGIPIEVSISRPDVVYKQLSTGRYYASLNANSLPAGAPISDFQAVITRLAVVSAVTFAGLMLFGCRPVYPRWRSAVHQPGGLRRARNRAHTAISPGMRWRGLRCVSLT